MTEAVITYTGDLATECVHRESGSRIHTDAPKDIQGKGHHFSPTDLVGVGLGSCMLTIMGILAKKLGLDLVGTKVVVTKEMASAPSRRIGKLRVEIYCPHRFDDEINKKLEKMAEGCPVHHSLHPDIKQEIIYHWGVSH